MKISNLHKAYLLLLVAVLTWCVLIIAAPLLAHAHHHISAGFIYLFFSKFCHQNPDRSFICINKPFAVCARCTGIYIGFLMGTVLYPIFSRRVAGNRIIIILFGVVLMATLIDVTGNFFHWWENNSWSRASLGAGIGILLACIIIPALLSIITAKENFIENGELNESKSG